MVALTIGGFITAYHFLSAYKWDFFFKYRAGIAERVEFPVFAARIDARRQIGDETGIELAACERCVENREVDADCNGLKTQRDEVAHESRCVLFPEWKDRGETSGGKFVFTVTAQVFEKNIAEPGDNITFTL